MANPRRPRTVELQRAALASLAAVAVTALLAGCGAVATAPAAPGPTPSSTPTGRLWHIVLEATVSGDGEATATYTGDPSNPAGGSETFQHRWTHEFDIPELDLTALGRVHLAVIEKSGANATITCTTRYDNRIGGQRKKTGAHQTAGCHISYGDAGDEEP